MLEKIQEADILYIQKKESGATMTEKKKNLYLNWYFKLSHAKTISILGTIGNYAKHFLTWVTDPDILYEL